MPKGKIVSRRARHSIKRYSKSSSNRKSVGTIVLIFSLLAFFFVMSLYIVKKKKMSIWDEYEKLLIVNAISSDGIGILTIDKKTGNQTQFYIDGEIVVDVSHGFGKYRVKNLYELDKSQKYEGELILATLQKNSFAPVFLWVNSDLTDIKIGKAKNIISVLSDYSETNINIVDRIRLIFYLLHRNSTMDVVEPGDVGFLGEETIGGEDVNIFGNNLPDELVILWADSYVSDNQIRFEIINRSNERVLPESIFEIFETTGAKVANTVKRYGFGQDIGSFCLIISNDERLLDYYGRIFDCTKKYEVGDTPFDFSIQISQEFVDKYK